MIGQPLFTTDDVENLREFDNFLVAPRKGGNWMHDLADRLQRYLDQQAENAAFQSGLKTGDFSDWKRLIGAPLSQVDETELSEG